jgi:hypothetical protein
MKTRRPTFFSAPRLVPVLLMLFLFVGFTVYLIPKAHAVNPSFDKAATATTSNSATVSPQVTPSITGEFIVVTVGIFDNNNPSYSVTVADGATTLTLAGSLELDTNTHNGATLNRTMYDAVFYGNTPNAALETWTVTLNKHTAGESARATIILFNNAPSFLGVTAPSNAGNAQCGATSSCTSVSPFLASGASYTSSAMLIAIVGTYAGATPGVGFSAPSNGCTAAEPFCSEYNVPGTAGSTFFNMGCTVTCGAWNLEAVVFDFNATGLSGSQSIGSCTTAGGTFAMVNQTLYMYEGSNPGPESVNNASVLISSVGGSTGTHTIQFVIYATPLSGSISPTNQLTLLYSKQVALGSGTGAATITVSPGTFLPTTGETWGIGVVGDNKITLVTSGLTGLYTFGGVPVSTSPQNAAFTAQGTSSGTELALCANAVYSILTTTTTTSVSTHVTTFTSTQTVSTGTGSSSFAINNPDSMILFLLLLLPTGLLLGATRNLVGALVGLAIGAIVAVVAGVLSPFFFTGLLIGLVAVAYVSRSRDN